MSTITYEDSKSQLKAIAANRGDVILLYEALTNLSISLVMGLEQYLRRFDSAQALPLLVSVVEKRIDDNSAGDVMVMAFRSIALIFEHVPSSYEGAQEFHKPLMRLSTRALHKALCGEWVLLQNDTEGLYEECLKTIRFVAKDDRTGAILRYAFIGDLLTLCAVENNVVARQSLETLYMLCKKVVMPSEFEKPQPSGGLFSFFKGKRKGSRSRDKATGGEESDNPIVINVENVIAPFLHTLIEQYTSVLSHVQEVWVLLEYSIQCLGTLMERALLCHRPHTATALVTKELPQLLFRVVAIIEENVTLEATVRNERTLFIESMLAVVASCDRGALAESLLTADAKQFFHFFLDDASGEITTLLDQPFPLGVMAARSTQRRDKDHITSIAAIRLFVLAAPNVPPEAFGLKPKTVLPVHQWMWEDELRHANRLVEEQCVALETSWTRVQRESAVVVHAKALPADLHTMTMARGFNGGHRNISRKFAPFVYHFVDEGSVRPVARVKQAGADPVIDLATPTSPHARHGSSSTRTASTASASSKTLRRKSSFSATDRQVLMNEGAYVPPSHIQIAEEYFTALCLYATHASGQMAKQLATCACASILQLMFLSNADARVGKIMVKAMLPLCEMFREALFSADKATKAVVLTMTEWLLRHPMAANWGFADTAERCGYVSQLDDTSKVTPLVAVTKDSKPTRTADLADRSGELARDIKAKLKRARTATGGGAAAAPGGAAGALAKATATLIKLAREPGEHERALEEFFAAVKRSKSVTPYEVHQMELATALLTYLLGGTSTADLLGPSFVFSSGASGSTFSRKMVESVDIASLLDEQRAVLPAAVMISSGMPVGDLLRLHISQKRFDIFVRLVAKSPEGLQLLVEHLVATLPLQSTFPLVESIVTHDRVACKTPLQAFQALSAVSPRVVLCGSVGSVASPAYVSASKNGSGGNGAAAAQGESITRDGSVVLFEASAKSEGKKTGSAGAKSGDGKASAATTTTTVPAIPIKVLAKTHCMRGHKFKEMPHYIMECLCDFCGCRMKSGMACRICNFDICMQCHSSYKGNVTLMKMMQSPAEMPRNRANLVACVGDMERFFRTGSTSTKGTQTAPTSQSSLQQLDRFSTRTQLLLRRKVADGGEAAEVVEVARLLLDHPILLRTAVYKVLQGYFTRGVLAGDPTGMSGGGVNVSSSDGDNPPAAVASASASASPTMAGVPMLSERQHRIAEQLAHEGVEDRYVLYRPTIGRCSYQETFLGLIYRQAFAVGNKNVLLQLENCLLRLEGSSDPLTLQTSAMPSPQEVASSTRNSRPSVDVGSATGGHSMYGSGADDDLGGSAVVAEQTFVFHHFETDSAPRCSCGQHSREDFATEGVDEMTVALPDFVRREDMLLLILLHRSFYSRSHAISEADVDSKALDESVFVNSAVTTAIVKALEASALRVAVLPQNFALPRWTSFVLRDARFLIQPKARERIARYLAYDARRSFIRYMRLFRQYRLDRTVSISPGEWARMANHKFAVNRANFLHDAYTVLRKSADARLPISIEFEGDVGVGQGPTAQFYTLLAQEVTRADLQLWRNVSGAAAPQQQQSQKSPARSLTSPVTQGSEGGRKREGSVSGGRLVLHNVPITSSKATASPNSGAAPALVNAPPEGFYPTRVMADGVGAMVKRGSGVLTATPKKPPSSSNGGVSFSSPSSPSASAVASPSRGVVVPEGSLGGMTRRRRENGQIVLADPRAVLQDYVQTQRDRAKAFYAIGAALGRAFMDEQVLPLPLCSALSVFLRSGVPPAKILLEPALMLDKDAEVPVDLLELPLRVARLVDPGVASSLDALSKMDAATLESLDLPFTLPGDDDFELIPGGRNVTVNSRNLARYQRRVINALLHDSVAFPLRMITMGCHDVVPREALGVLGVYELMNLLCGEEKNANEPLWTAAEVGAVLVGDHGYQNDSPQLSMLGRILASRLTPKEQRAFLLFCTGCPRLPVGGIRALGAITVVKRSNAFDHARGMAAAEERRARGDDEDDEADPEDDGAPLFAGGGRATTTVASDHDGSLSTGPKTPTPGRTVSSLSRAGGYGSTEATSVTFELPDSEWALPSVNTCFRYLKLPPYPSEDLMYRKLLLSITQSGDTFELS